MVDAQQLNERRFFPGFRRVMGWWLWPSEANQAAGSRSRANLRCPTRERGRLERFLGLWGKEDLRAKAAQVPCVGEISLLCLLGIVMVESEMAGGADSK